MKPLALLLLPGLLVLSACHSNGDEAHRDAGAANVERAAASSGVTPGPIHWEYTFQHHDARQMANRMRAFLVGTEVQITASDQTTWKVRGTSDEVALARFLAVSFDDPELTRDHRGGLYTLENTDARLLLNSARGRDDWGDGWLVATNATDRWYAMIPDVDIEAFTRLVGELDRAQ